MVSFRRWLDSALNRFTAPNAGPDLRRRSRVITALVGVINLSILICVPLDVSNHAWGSALGETAGIVIANGCLLALKRGRATLVGHILTALFVLIMFAGAFDKGGLIATEIVWQCGAILFCMLILGARAAFGWTLVATAGLIIHTRGFDPTPFHGKAAALAVPSDYALEIGTLYFVIWGLAFAFDRARAKSLSQLETRNEEMHRVLEHARDGLLTIDRDGRIGTERSKRATELLGDFVEGAILWDVLAAANPENASQVPWLRLGWESVLEDMLPRELSLEQMPKRITLGGRTLSLSVTVIEQQGAVTGALIVLHDISEEIARERAEQSRRDLLAVFEHLRTDAGAVADFVKEMDRLAGAVVEPSTEAPTVMRNIHTIKGNAALFGVQSMADLCHAVEERCANAETAVPSDADRSLLTNRWSEISRELSEWTSAMNGDHQLNLARAEVDELRAAVAAQAPYSEIAATIARWELMPLTRVFARLARQGKALAKKLGKDVDFVVGDGVSAIRVDGDVMSPLFSSLVHAIRNAVDHGIDSPEERALHGKSPRGEIVLTASNAANDDLVMEIRDDGEGINWALVREKAKERGLPYATEGDLVAAILSDSFSTRAEANEVSGRGVGLAALRDAAEQLGGVVRIQSRPTFGSSVQVCIPQAHHERQQLAA